MGEEQEEKQLISPFIQSDFCSKNLYSLSFYPTNAACPIYGMILWKCSSSSPRNQKNNAYMHACLFLVHDRMLSFSSQHHQIPSILCYHHWNKVIRYWYILLSMLLAQCCICILIIIITKVQTPTPTSTLKYLLLPYTPLLDSPSHKIWRLLRMQSLLKIIYLTWQSYKMGNLFMVRIYSFDNGEWDLRYSWGKREAP